MRQRSSRKTPVFVSVILLLTGVGSLAALVAVAALLGRTEIELNRNGDGFRGYIRWVLAGVPAYWRNLDGVARVERNDYHVRGAESGVGIGNRPLKNVARLSFLDAKGVELAWTERTCVMNEREAMQRFLSGESHCPETGTPAVRFHFEEPVSGRAWDRLRALGIALVSLPPLALGGLLCILSGSIPLARRIAGRA